LRLNSRMSHCASRMCSSSIHGECGNFSGFLPAQLRRQILYDIVKLGMSAPAFEKLKQMFPQRLLVILGHPIPPRTEPSSLARVGKARLGIQDSMRLKKVWITVVCNIVVRTTVEERRFSAAYKRTESMGLQPR
jgi:hypothetical protein